MGLHLRLKTTPGLLSGAAEDKGLMIGVALGGTGELCDVLRQLRDLILTFELLVIEGRVDISRPPQSGACQEKWEVWGLSRSF